VLNDLLIIDIDYKDSAVNKLVDSLSLNIILSKLSFSGRTEFYNYIAENDFVSAKSLVSREIPDFYKILAERVTETFKKV